MNQGKYLRIYSDKNHKYDKHIREISTIILEKTIGIFGRLKSAEPSDRESDCIYILYSLVHPYPRYCGGFGECLSHEEVGYFAEKDHPNDYETRSMGEYGSTVY